MSPRSCKLLDTLNNLTLTSIIPLPNKGPVLSTLFDWLWKWLLLFCPNSHNYWLSVFVCRRKHNKYLNCAFHKTDDLLFVVLLQFSQVRNPTIVML